MKSKNEILMENIKALCAKKKITIMQLEDDASLARGTVYRWDKSTPSLDSVTKVAEYFKVKVDYLIKEH